MKSVPTDQHGFHKTNKRQAIDQALAEARQDIFISVTAMNNWINSWGRDDELPIPEPDIASSRD